MTYGFIGLGNMGGSIIRGMQASESFSNASICGCDADNAKLASAGIAVCDGIQSCIAKSDVIVLAVKPQSLPSVLDEAKAALSPDKLLISIAAGMPISFYQQRCPGIPFVRVMPNINALVGAAVSAICGGDCATQEHINIVKEMFSAVGSVYEIPENLFSAFSAIGSASPAYAYMFVDALASAGVKGGLPRAVAVDVATNAVLGSMLSLKKSGAHPIELADRVCSPGGTTIEGVHKLRAGGFDSAIYEAIAAVIAKDKSLG